MRQILRLTLLFALALAPVACGDGTGVGEPGLLSLYLTDAEGDVTQAVVTIDRVEIVGEGGVTVLLDEPFTTDLLTLASDFATLVDEVVLEGGVYTQLRFIIPEACIAVEQADMSTLVYASNGFENCGAADGALQLPSYDETGIKVNLPGGGLQVDGNAQILLVDFDVGQSFGQLAGGSGTWVLTPVITAEDVSLSSSITVELGLGEGVDLDAVGATLADFEATLDTEPVALPFTDTDGDGVFTATFGLLMPDQTYQVSVGLRTGVSFTFVLDPTSPQSIDLGATESATAAFSVTSVAPM